MPKMQTILVQLIVYLILSEIYNRFLSNSCIIRRTNNVIASENTREISFILYYYFPCVLSCFFVDFKCKAANTKFVCCICFDFVFVSFNVFFFVFYLFISLFLSFFSLIIS